MTNKNTMTKNQILEAELIAKYFGFSKESPKEVTKEDLKTISGICKEKDYLSDDLFPIEELYAQLKKHKEERDVVESALIYYEGSASGPHKKHRKKVGTETINLQMVNVSGSIAEASLIKTAITILNQSGVKKMSVRINNVGDRESQLVFAREATSYYRKNISELSSHERQLFKEGLYTLINHGKRHNSQIHESAPKTMEYLGEDSRKRFSEVLEYLETLNIPYEIDQMIVGDPNYSTHTVFEIINPEDGSVIASGSRYDALARKSGLRKDIPSAGVIIRLPKPKKVSEKTLKKFDKAKFFFLQIGYEAKLRCLSIIDELRIANIPVLHKIYKDKLSVQIAAAKKAGCDYLIIMGQKEAMEDELILRDKESRSQQIVDHKDFVNHIKKL